MLISNILFYIFSVLLIFSSIMVIVSKNPVFSLLFLVFCFICSSCLLFLLECEFLALLFVIVYVGAIAILFLFSIMMLESKQMNLSKNSIKYFPIGVVFVILLIIPMFNIIDIHFSDTTQFSGSFYENNFKNWYALVDATNDVNVYGYVLYSHFVIQFLVAGLILLLILIGVVHLTKSNKKDTIQQVSFKQLARRAKIF
jgi:NADH-quinone oxidoreductase subunit J